MQFYQLMFLDIFRVILKNIQKSINILPLYQLEHPLAFRVQILSHVKLFLFLRFVFLLDFPFFLLDNLLHFVLFEPQNVIQVPLVDVDVFVLLLCFRLLQQLQIDFHTLFDSVVGNRPSADHSVVDLALLDPNDEMPGTVAHSLLQILDQLLGVLAKVNIDSLGLRLQDTVFVDQNESHLIC